MTRTVYGGGWYCDALPTGEFCVLMPLSHVRTHLGTVPLPPGEGFGVLYLRCTATGGFRFAGQPHDRNDVNYEWSDGGWQAIPTPYLGVSPVIYDLLGTYHQNDGSAGSQGYRYVQEDGTQAGRLVTGDATYFSPAMELSQWTELAPDLCIGQGHPDWAHDAAWVWDRGTLRLLETGPCTFIRANRDGDDVAIAFVKRDTAVIIQTTLAELRALPPVVAPEPPEPIGPRSDPRPADGTSYDLLGYILGDPSQWPRSGPTHPMNQTVMGDLFHFVKFDNPDTYETWAFDDNWIYHIEDASPAEPYSFADPRWFPRHMVIGEAGAFDSGEHETIFRRRGDCHEVRREPFRRKMWVQAVYDRFYWGPDLGERDTLVVAYDPTGGVHIPERGVELGYYARGAGSCRWEWYRSDLVYANGPAQFPAEARGAQSDFYLLGGRVIGPALTGCVPQVCPHLPPWEPEPEPEPEPPYYPPEEYPDMDPEIGAIKGPGNQFGRVLLSDAGTGPFGWFPVRFDRDTPDDDCWFELTKPDSRYSLRHTKVDGLLGADATEHSDSIPKQFYLKPGNDRGILESPVLIYDPASPLIVGYLTWPEKGVSGPAFTWVKR